MCHLATVHSKFVGYQQNFLWSISQHSLFTLLGTRISFSIEVQSLPGINLILDKVYKKYLWIALFLFKFLHPTLSLFWMDYVGAAYGSKGGFRGGEGVYFLRGFK